MPSVSVYLSVAAPGRKFQPAECQCREHARMMDPSVPFFLPLRILLFHSVFPYPFSFFIHPLSFLPAHFLCFFCPFRLLYSTAFLPLSPFLTFLFPLPHSFPSILSSSRRSEMLVAPSDEGKTLRETQCEMHQRRRIAVLAACDVR